MSLLGQETPKQALGQGIGIMEKHFQGSYMFMKKALLLINLFGLLLSLVGAEKAVLATPHSSGKTYPGFGLENSLDGDPNNDYTAFYENAEQSFTLKLSTPVRRLAGVVEFESDANYASDWQVFALDKDGKEISAFSLRDAKGKKQNFDFLVSKPIFCLKFVFTKFHGQQRLLLRLISLKQIKELSKNTVINKQFFHGAEFNINELLLDFSKMPGIPRKIQVFSTDSQYKRKYEVLINISGNTESILRIPVNKRAAHITFTFTDFVLLKSGRTNKSMEPTITVNLDKTELKKFEQYSELHKKIIMQANDPENPLAIRFPITEFYYARAQDILRKHNLQNGSDFAKILAFMEDITFMNVGYPLGRTPFEWSNERIGDCGSFSYILLALAKTQNLKGRVLNMWNYPKGSGHVVTEIQCQGKSYVFDPTYGLYYKNEKTGEIMSFEDLRNPANKAVPVYINKKRYAESGEQTGWGTQRVYLHGNPIGPIGPDKPMTFPLFLKAGDVVLMPSLSAFQGAEYLGAGMTNNNHHWTFSGLTPGRNYQFIITPNHIGGDSPKKIFTFVYRFLRPNEAEKNVTVKPNFGKLSPVVIDFTATAPIVELEVRHHYTELRYHYLTIKKYELKER